MTPPDPISAPTVCRATGAPADRSGARTERPATARVASVVLLVVGVAIAVACPPAHVAAGPVLVGVALCAAALRITFSTGAGLATPLPLVFVSLWFWLGPALLIPVSIAGQLVASAIALRFAAGDEPAPPWSATVAAAWPSAAPAALVALAAPGAASMDLVWFVVLAVCGQVAIRGAVDRWQIRALDQASAAAPPMRAAAAATVVDVALGIVGLEVAIVAAEARWTLAFALPFLGLLAYFAREREHRLKHALELSAAYRGTAALMGDVLEADDAYTGGEHTRGVVEFALRTGEVLGLDADATRALEFGALLHDLGKLRVPNEVINKPGRLTRAEWEIIRRHPEVGEAMLLRVGGVLAEAAPAVRGHHERFDGTGYPDGLAGADIPIQARIITVCDAFSAMTTTRSYRSAMSPHEAVAELRRCTPGQFDPQVVDALVTSLDLDPDGALRVASRVLRPFAEGQDDEASARAGGAGAA